MHTSLATIVPNNYYLLSLQKKGNRLNPEPNYKYVEAIWNVMAHTQKLDLVFRAKRAESI